jgi:hypothetical protein
VIATLAIALGSQSMKAIKSKRAVKLNRDNLLVKVRLQSGIPPNAKGGLGGI